MENEAQWSIGDYTPPQHPESPYERIGHAELIDEFYETEGDSAIGRELSVRIFARAGFAGDPTTTPLIGRDGRQTQQDGKPLYLADYVNFAVSHHFEAIESILDFLLMEEGSPDYETMRSTIAARLHTARS